MAESGRVEILTGSIAGAGAAEECISSRLLFMISSLLALRVARGGQSDVHEKVDHQELSCALLIKRRLSGSLRQPNQIPPCASVTQSDVVAVDLAFGENFLAGRVFGDDCPQFSDECMHAFGLNQG